MVLLYITHIIQLYNFVYVCSIFRFDSHNANVRRKCLWVEKRIFTKHVIVRWVAACKCLDFGLFRKPETSLVLTIYLHRQWVKNLIKHFVILWFKCRLFLLKRCEKLDFYRFMRSRISRKSGNIKMLPLKWVGLKI